MKKLISILVLFLSHYAALANDSDIKSHSFSGFYINPNIAYAHTDAVHSGGGNTYDGTDYIGGVSLGYGKLYKGKYYLGIDLSADINSAEASEVLVNYNATYDYNLHTKIREKIGVTLEAGYTIDHSSLLYLKAGAALMHLNAFQERRYQTGQGNPAMVWMDEPWDYGAKDVWEAKIGIGFEEQLNPNTTLTIEVDYIDDNNGLFAGGSNNVEITAKQVKYMLGLSYYF